MDRFNERRGKSHEDDIEEVLPPGSFLGKDPKYSDYHDCFTMIREDISSASDSIPISNILNLSIDQLQRHLEDIKSGQADTTYQMFLHVKGLMDKNALPKNASWYPDLEKKMSGLAILCLGAKFNKDFEQEAKQASDQEMKKLDAWLEWITSVKHLSLEDQEKLTNEEYIALSNEFEAWRKENQ